MRGKNWDHQILIKRSKAFGTFGPSERSNGLGPSDADRMVLKPRKLIRAVQLQGQVVGPNIDEVWALRSNRNQVWTVRSDKVEVWTERGRSSGGRRGSEGHKEVQIDGEEVRKDIGRS